MRKVLFFALFGMLYAVAEAHTLVKQPTVVVTPQVRTWDASRDIHIIVIIRATHVALPGSIPATFVPKDGSEKKVGHVPLPTAIVFPVLIPDLKAVRPALP